MSDAVGDDPCADPRCQAQRMDALARLSSAVAHDFNNVLSVIFGYTELLVEGAPDDDTRNLLLEVTGAAERAMAISQQLMGFGGRLLLQRTTTPVAPLLRRLEPAIAAALGPETRLDLDAPDDVPAARGDPDELERALLALAAYAHGAPAVRIAARGDGRSVVLTVTADGRELAGDAVDRMFEPFYSVKSTGRGTGIGLARVYAGLRQMGGSAAVASGGGGTTFELTLPRADARVSGSS